ncbi:hypothetical protein P7C73_g4758, partial [Tremellales sp. Uapishka_1]
MVKLTKSRNSLAATRSTASLPSPDGGLASEPYHSEDGSPSLHSGYSSEAGSSMADGDERATRQKGKADRTKDQTGAGRYPPSSFSSHGWNFGRMRSFSRKGKSKAEEGDTDDRERIGKEAAEEGYTSSMMGLRIGDPPGVPPVPKRPSLSPLSPASPIKSEQLAGVFSRPQSNPSHTRSLPPPFRPRLITAVPDISPSVSLPLSSCPSRTSPLYEAAQDHLDPSFLSPTYMNPPTRPSLSASGNSGSSGASDRPLLTRAPSKSTPTKKLIKTRPSTGYDMELTPQSRGQAPARPGESPTLIRFSMAFGHDNIPLLPPGAAAPEPLTLIRNSSSCTSNSSDIGPTTDDSATIETPHVSIMVESQMPGWNGIEIGRPLMSRNDSYQDGDDGSTIHLRKMPPSSHVNEGSECSTTMQPSSPTRSSMTCTPTVSTSSTARARKTLRVNTSGLESTVETVTVERSSIAPSKRTVVFEQGQSTVYKRHSRSRPSLNRMRSDSVGGISTTSTFSIGEVTVATKSIRSDATTVDLDRSVAEEMVGVLMDSSETMNRMLSAEMDRGDWEFLSSSRQTSTSTSQTRARTFSNRPAPPPPHLQASLPSPPATALPRISTASTESLRSSTPSTAKLTRPGMPDRQGSLSRLWRAVSSSGSKKKRGEDVLTPLSSPLPPPATEMSKRERKLSNKQEKRRRRTSNSHMPPPMPSPRRIDLATRSTSAVRSPESLESSRSTLQSTIAHGSITDSIQQDFAVIRGSHIPLRAATVPVAATASWVNPLGPFTPPLSSIVDDYFPETGVGSTSKVTITSETHTRHDRSNSLQSHDVKRKYRQTLVEIKDDRVFQQVLEDLARLENNAAPAATAILARTPSRDILETKARQEAFQAWFLIREVVQGERRHGRLLARGVETVQAAVKSRAQEIPPLPMSSSSPLSPSPSKAKGKRPKVSPSQCSSTDHGSSSASEGHIQLSHTHSPVTSPSTSYWTVYPVFSPSA